MTDPTPLPLGWIWTTIGAVLEVHYGKGLTKTNRDENGNIPVYGSNGIVGYHNSALVDGACIVIGRKGAAGAVHISQTSCWPIDTTYYTQPPDGVSMKYAFYNLGSLGLASLDKSTAIPGLNRDDLYAQPLPLPPLPEQHRIVEAIETQFTRLDAGIAGLEQVRAKLRRYRAAVLKAACEGKLVPQDPTDEPATDLLAQINEGQESELEGLSVLPQKWSWEKIGELAIVRGGKRLPNGADFSEEVTPFLYIRAGNLKNGTVIGEIKFISEQLFDKLEIYQINPGDVYITIVGACIGDAGVIPDRYNNTILTENAAKIVTEKTLDSHYLAYWLRSPLCQEYIQRKILSATLGKLALYRIKELPVPLPPLAEQQRIVAEVERRLSVVDEVEAVIEANLRRAARLRQAILKKAFAGQLVPQNPADEPASVLLERIRAAKGEIDRQMGLPGVT